MIKELTIEVTKVQGRVVHYSGVPWGSVCTLSTFPYTPKVGEKFILSYDTEYKQKIVSLVPKDDAVSK